MKNEKLTLLLRAMTNLNRLLRVSRSLNHRLKKLRLLTTLVVRKMMMKMTS